MSAAENLKIVKAGYAAFSAGDAATAMADFADDIEWIIPGNSTVSGTYRGKAEVGGFFMKLGEKSFKTEPEHFLADDERVVVLTRTTADGQSADQADVLTLRDGKIVKFQSAGDTALEERIWGTKS
ncbi:MAG TPA: nuclear transport factor 2 family protein [Mycobacteriales bacterium]|jgi:hypothetical protein|nr:nuclear transport factor 2 family protein [Mycobacteriales bacterium]